MKKSVLKLLLSFFIFNCYLTIDSLHAQTKSTTLSTENKVTEKVLQDILDQNKHFATQGKVADYIPELGKMSADAIALSVVFGAFALLQKDIKNISKGSKVGVYF